MAQTRINCLNCDKETWVENKEIARGYGKFCSIKCSGAYNGAQRPKPKNNVKCALCNIDFYMNSSRKGSSKSGLFFCCRAHKDIGQRLSSGITEIMLPHYGSGSKNYRDIAFRTKEKKCERCGYDANEAAIIVHHIDRNRANADISNLEVLCCNCHAIEHLGEPN